MPRKKKIALSGDQIAQTEALASVLSLEQIADYFGISSKTFYRICMDQPEVLSRYKKGKSKAIGNVGKGLLKQALEGNTVAAMFYLKTQARWRETAHVSVDAPLLQDNSQHLHLHESSLRMRIEKMKSVYTEEELELLRRLLAKAEQQPSIYPQRAITNDQGNGNGQPRRS